MEGLQVVGRASYQDPYSRLGSLPLFARKHARHVATAESSDLKGSHLSAAAIDDDPRLRSPSRPPPSTTRVWGGLTVLATYGMPGVVPVTY